MGAGDVLRAPGPIDAGARSVSDLLVRGGEVLQRDGLVRADVHVRDGRVHAVGSALVPASGGRVLDADGLVVLPGVIDAHTHFALDTGRMATRDDYELGSASAAAGGVTTVINFAPQRPRQSLLAAVAAERAKAEGRSLVDYGLHVCVGVPGEGWERELDELAGVGVTSFKVHTTYRDTMFYTRDWDWYQLARACAVRDLLVMVHCENDDIVTGATEAQLSAGHRSFAWHAAARPAIAEVEAVARALTFCAETGFPTYLVHLTTAKSVELVTRGRELGLLVFGEVCAHHLALDDSVYAGPDASRFVMIPPLRSAHERAGLLDEVVDGRVHTLGSDHCGYSLEQRAGAEDFTAGSPGIPGVETLLPVAFTELSARGVPLEAIAGLLTMAPAAIFGLRGKGELSTGFDGDLVLFDPAARRVLNERELHSAAGYSPWHGRELRGRVIATVCRGTVVYQEGAVRGAPGHGRFVPCERFSRERADAGVREPRVEALR